MCFFFLPLTRDVALKALFPIPRLSQAQAVTLTVAQAFRLAFEFWQAAKGGMMHSTTSVIPAQLLFVLLILVNYGL